MPELHPENLRPVQTEEEARELGRAGGIASGKARREKKLMSQLYADAIADLYDVEDGTLREVISTIVARCDAASVSLLRELREATEGSRQKIDVESAPVKIIINGVTPEPSGDDNSD